jgi:hypothetical protein
MSKVITVFLFLTTWISSSAQTEIKNYQAFVVDNKEAIWIEVYHREDDPKDLHQKVFNHLQKKPWLANLRFEESDIVGELVDYRPDYKRYGGKFMNTSNIIRTGKWKGKLRINFKDGKYRVILYGLQYDALQSSSGSGKATIEQHSVSGSLTEFSLNDLRTSFRKKGLKNLDILHFSFKDSFTIVANQVIDSDW